MALFLQRMFDAMANGAIYASLAVALTMVYRASGVLNLAQGEMAMFSAYIALLLRSDADGGANRGFGPERLPGTDLAAVIGAPWPMWAAVLGATVFGAALGAGIQRFVVEPVGGRNSTSPLPLIGATLGVFLILRGLATNVWGAGRRELGSLFPTESSDYFAVAGARLRYSTIGTVAVLVGVLALLAVLERRSRLGLAFRALVSNRESAALVGIRVSTVLMAGWAIAAALGALGGTVIAGQLRVAPTMMARLLIFALAASILGGLGNARGAVVGGFAFALIETFMIGYVSFITADVAIVYTLGFLILVLLVRPGGLLGGGAVGDRTP